MIGRRTAVTRANAREFLSAIDAGAHPEGQALYLGRPMLSLSDKEGRRRMRLLRAARGAYAFLQSDPMSNRRARRRAAAVLRQVERQRVKVADLRKAALLPQSAQPLRPATETPKRTWREAIARTAAMVAGLFGRGQK